MWLNPQDTTDLVTFTEETFKRKLHFCTVLRDWNNNEIGGNRNIFDNITYLVLQASPNDFQNFARDEINGTYSKLVMLFLFTCLCLNGGIEALPILCKQDFFWSKSGT